MQYELSTLQTSKCLVLYITCDLQDLLLLNQGSIVMQDAPLKMEFKGEPAPKKCLGSSWGRRELSRMFCAAAVL